MSIYKTDEEVENLLNHSKNGLHKVDVEVRIIGSGNHGHQDNGNGKKNGEQKRDLESKILVGTLANLIGGKATSELMGVGETQVSQYRNGKNANNEIKTELVEALDKRLDSVSDKAMSRVETLLDIFVEDKISDLKASEIPSAAEKLINIFEKTRKKSDGGIANRPQVIIYAPRQLNIGEYITKEV